jgi:hypothetical protein
MYALIRLHLLGIEDRSFVFFGLVYLTPFPSVCEMVRQSTVDGCSSNTLLWASSELDQTLHFFFP